jgi:ArsR family transcriptional regulator
MPASERNVAILKALADETRLSIVGLLGDGPLCACRILDRFEITQPTLSYHMKILTESGLVKGVRTGAWMWYSLDAKRLGEFQKSMASLSAAGKPGAARCCKAVP